MGKFFGETETKDLTKTMQEPIKQEKGAFKALFVPEAIEEHQAAKTAQGAKETDFMADFTKWAEENERTGGKYLLGRGISLDTQRRFKVGFCPSWKHPKTGSYGGARCIIPTSPESYLARATDPAAEWRAPKAGRSHTFNMKTISRAAKDGRPVYVVEGEIDAMSLEEINAHAVGLGSKSYINLFFKTLDALAPSLGHVYPSFVIVPDYDPPKPGQDEETKAKEREAFISEIANGLTKRGFFAMPARPFPKIEGIATQPKDVNALLMESRERLELWESDNATLLADLERDAQEDFLAEFKGGFRKFCEHLAENANFKPIETGFHDLDEALGGGLYRGFYVLGAVPSLGKTTLALQIADYIAGTRNTGGQPKEAREVLFFALEMSQDEMIAKSLSRFTALEALARNWVITTASTKNQILRNGNGGENQKSKGALVLKAMADYEQDQAKRLCFIEGVGDISAAQIRGTLEKFTRLNKRPPVVFVDYMQIMASPDAKSGLTDKQIVDKNVLELKRISRDFKTPVIAISNLNRDAYNKELTMASFKETGAIEYTADALIGLQFQGVGGKDFDEREAKNRNSPDVANLNEREIEAVILKNRNGRTGGRCNFLYYPAYDLFKESEEAAF